MTDHASSSPMRSLTRIAAIAGVRVRRVVRTRIALAALLFALLPWGAVAGHALITRLAALAEFSVVGLTVLAAGAIGDDISTGEHAIVMTHDSSPLEMLAGQAAASLGLAAIVVALQLPIALAGVAIPNVLPLLLCMAWLAALLAGWLALMLLFATFVDGKGNAIAMIAVLFVPFAVDAGLLERLPPAPAAAVRNALQLLPQVGHATAMFRAVLDRSPTTIATPFVLLASPFIYFAWASYRLYRLEPAGRLTQ